MEKTLGTTMQGIVFFLMEALKGAHVRGPIIGDRLGP